MKKDKPVIDLSSKNGNAIALVGFVKQFAQDNPNKIINPDDIITEMLEGENMHHTIEVFKKHFSNHVNIYNSKKVN